MSKLPRCRVLGPLAEYADGFRAELDRLGYTDLSREYKVNQVGRLSRWMAVQGLRPGDLDQARLAAFLTTMATSRRRPPTKGCDEAVAGFPARPGCSGSGMRRAA